MTAIIITIIISSLSVMTMVATIIELTSYLILIRSPLSELKEIKIILRNLRRIKRLASLLSLSDLPKNQKL